MSAVFILLLYRMWRRVVWYTDISVSDKPAVSIFSEIIRSGSTKRHATIAPFSSWCEGLRPLACWIAGSNPAGGIDVCLLWALWFSGVSIWDGPITRPEETYRLWCVIVWSRNLKTEAALARGGLLRQRERERGRRNIPSINHLEYYFHQC